MHNKLNVFTNRKFILSIILGFSSLLLSPYGIEVYLSDIPINFPWTLFLPILITMAYGWQYGIVAGISGGALFPFLLWPNNGWANVLTALIFLGFYALLGLLNDRKYFNKFKNIPIRILLAISVGIASLYLYDSFLFNRLLALNPPFWEKSIVNHLPQEMLLGFAFKDSINLIILTITAETLLRMPPNRRLLKLPTIPAMQKNFKIFIAAIFSSILIWLVYVGLSFFLIKGDVTLHQVYLSLAFFVIISGGFAVSRMLFYYSENQVKIQNSLNTSEEQLKLISNNFVSGMIYQVAMLDESSRKFTYLSDAVKKLYGCSADEAKENPDLIYNRIFKADIGDLIQKEKEALKTMSIFKTEARVINPDGSLRWSYYVSRPRIINNMVCWDGMEVDITERKRVEQELIQAKEKAEENERKLVEAQELSHIGSWEYIMESDTVTWSKELFNIFDRPHDLPAPKFSVQQSFYTKESYAILERAVQDCVQREIPYEIELDIIVSSGSIKQIISKGDVIKDQNNKIIGSYGTAQDITEKKKIEQELIRAKERAEESDRIKTAFLQNMSHEIRTPMNSIMGFASLLLDEEDRNSINNYSNIIYNNAEQLLHVIDDIVIYSQLQNKQFTFVPKEFDANILISDIKQSFNLPEYQKGVELKSELPDFVPITIYSDYDKIRQVFTNLISNAYKYTPNGKISFGITIEKSELLFFVKDTGMGIPKLEVDKIFDRFYRASNVNSGTIGGTGLGLSIVKELIELLGGKIWVESEVGKGSTFFFTIPL